MTLLHARNPLQLFRRVFEEHVTAPLAASRQKIHEHRPSMNVRLLHNVQIEFAYAIRDALPAYFPTGCVMSGLTVPR
jgi:hypothetical protein